MKCSKCGEVIDKAGMVCTLVREDATYTATLHILCFRQIVGHAESRRIESLAFDSGWIQTGLPMFRN